MRSGERRVICKFWAADPKPDSRGDLTVPRNLEELEHITAIPGIAWGPSWASAALQAGG